MREILFKAKRIDNGEWVEGLLWKKKYNSSKIFISCFPDKDDNEEAYVVDANTICQYTGLTDDIGNKIWENDIVEAYRSIYSINWDEGRARYDARQYKCAFEEVDAFFASCSKVIGNIFDNPELLEGGAK